jgi:hypothetical protein
VKIIYIEESDSAIIDPGIPDECFSGTISGYDLGENAVIHRDEEGKTRSVEILSGASKLFDLRALSKLGLVEYSRHKSMSVEEFREWREKLIEEKRKSAKTGRSS